MPDSIVIPYVRGMLRAETYEAVLASGPPFSLAPIPPEDPQAYARLLVGLWSLGRSFVIVEHDMAPSIRELDRLRSCSEAWCGHRYYCGSQLVRMSFGVVRFDASVMAAWPTLAAQAAMIAGDPRRPTPWGSLAESMASKMLTVGYTWHEHPGVVTHLHGRGAYT